MNEKIEEIAEIMYQVEAFELETLAEALYNAGYRKESDTARELLTELVKRAEKISFFDCRMGLDLDELAEKYGVDLGE